VAGDGEEGFRLYLHAFDSGNPFDVVFLDVMMPEANGQEVLAAIREFEKEQDISVENGVPVIMTTALDDGINLYQAHANGCVDYIVKPLSREKILKALQRLGLSTSTTSQGS
jgi:two-component system chemotaxis response regulator CheY